MSSKLAGSLLSNPGLSNIIPGRFSIAKEVRSSFFSDKVNFWSFLFCIFLLISQLGIVLYYFKKLPLEIPIFYSNPWGTSILAKNIFIFLLPLLAISFTILNSIISVLLFRQNFQSISDNRQSMPANKFLARVLVISNLVVGFITFYGTVKIVTLLA